MPTLTFTTPKGIATWPKLNEPDTKFKEEGEYSVALVLTPEDAAPIIEKADKFLSEFSVAQAKLLNKKSLKLANSNPWKEDADREGNATGNMLLRFKMKASAISKRDGKKIEFTPALFDRNGKPTDVSVGHGSVIKVNFEVVPWYTPALGCGIQFRLNAVQVLEAKNRSKSDNAKDYGFDVEAGDPETMANETGAPGFDDSGSDGDGTGEPTTGGDF